MKKTQTAPQAPQPLTREQQEQAMQQLRDQLLEKLEPVQYIGMTDPLAGFGYYGDKLVEFDIDPRHLDADTVENDKWFAPITLRESLDWLIKMEFALSRFSDECIQTGGAWPRWLASLKSELK